MTAFPHQHPVPVVPVPSPGERGVVGAAPGNSHRIARLMQEKKWQSSFSRKEIIFKK